MQAVSAYMCYSTFRSALCADPSIHLGFRGFWLTSAIRQLFDLQVCTGCPTPTFHLTGHPCLDQSQGSDLEHSGS